MSIDDLFFTSEFDCLTRREKKYLQFALHADEQALNCSKKSEDLTRDEFYAECNLIKEYGYEKLIGKKEEGMERAPHIYLENCSYGKIHAVFRQLYFKGLNVRDSLDD